ncbi:hypothetical protein CAPTEDRAFT_189388 [Capitella teleta]|uniref:Transposable element P transposase-like RNase H domain-containing protein n=1 Tax=Capitella teleta TaxID=283909 RepID=R7UW71_CAPTE|nr:hypothetical protein CAPTEDRAFT_189388 [Capitella teleta]|eukprot:ELU07606.1 hypothetical protein CAPTEDRAFT_189388 [Capitella teleta]
MAQALERNASRDLWQEVSHRMGGSTLSTESFDDVEGNEQVCILFRDKYDELYSSVSYDKQGMKQLSIDVDREASLICGMGKSSSKHHFTSLDVRKAVKKLKGGKSDARPSISSDNCIKTCDELRVYLSLFLSALLTSSLAPPAMLESVLVPIPKSRKNCFFSDQHVSTDGSANCIPLSFIISAKSATLLKNCTGDQQMYNKCSLMFDAKSILEHLDWDTNRMEMFGFIDYDK